MEEIIEHFCHEHPLKLTKNVGIKETGLRCYGCKNPVTSEPAYICVNRCGSESMILHKKCGELPKQISHPSHSQHLLHLFHFEKIHTCNLCRKYIHHCIGYRCSSCDFDIDMSCLVQETLIKLQHPSHHHVLTLMRKPAFSFCCDGCGSEDRDMAYVCSTCDQLMIHKTCASLPPTLQTDHHHHHLSLAFNFPIIHSRFYYKCEICSKDFINVYWVYYCGDCRFFAHLKCATSEKVAESSSLNNTEGSNLIQLPIGDISKELITPFIIRENGEIPDEDAMPSLINPATWNSSMVFNYHNHPLMLVREDEEKSEEVKICDVCVSTISSPPYYKCTTTCTAYFLHSTCYFLPKTLSRLVSDKLYGACAPTNEYHIFRLYTASLETTLRLRLRCHLCKLRTNGMVYMCGCGKCIDVKCASLPTTLKHSFHPQHKRLDLEKVSNRRVNCYATGCAILSQVAYCCTTCDFAIHLFCALQPRSVRDKRWDKNHSLVLTCNASLDHPTDFYCESCEEEMHPKEWMYNCRACDNSFHPHCLTASGGYRNIKFGHQFEIDHRFHPHPLTYNIVTLKLRCDICMGECYRYPGVECELCNYVACRYCAHEHVKV